jgi:hypothetical protein
MGLGVISGVVVLGFVLSGGARKAPESNPPTGSAEPNPPAPAETERPASAEQTQGSSLTWPGVGPVSVAPAPASLITNWEDKLDEILGAEGATEPKARQMLEMFARLPLEGQVEVAKHLCNLMPDQDYESLSQLLANPHLPPEVLDTFMADALNRPNSLKLPALLEVARTTQHPKAADAKEVLGFFLEDDYGDDWTKWQEKLQEWLRENPD